MLTGLPRLQNGTAVSTIKETPNYVKKPGGAILQPLLQWMENKYYIL